MIDINRTTLVRQRNEDSKYLLQSRRSSSDHPEPLHASFSYRQTGSLSSRSGILLVDFPGLPSQALKESIERATSWPVTLRSSFVEGLRALVAGRATIEIAAFSIRHAHHRAIQFVKSVNQMGMMGRGVRPFLLALSAENQPPEFAARLDKFGIQLLLRKYPDQIVEVIKKLQWHARTESGLPTVIVERRGGEIVGTRVRYRGANTRLRIGPRLFPLAAYFAIHRRAEHSTDILTNILGISLQSLKQYLLCLRHAFDEIRPDLGLSARGKDVFWTKHLPGGFLHGMKANAEIEELDEFFFPDETAETAPSLSCLCRQRKPRSRTTWSHIGWMCEECVRELQDAGEIRRRRMIPLQS